MIAQIWRAIIRVLEIKDLEPLSRKSTRFWSLIGGSLGGFVSLAVLVYLPLNFGGFREVQGSMTANSLFACVTAGAAGGLFMSWLSELFHSAQGWSSKIWLVISTVIGGALILSFAKLFSTHAFSVYGFKGIPPLFQTHRNELIGLALLGSVGASAVVVTTNFRKVFGLVSVLKGSLYGALIGVFAYSAVQFYATLFQTTDSSSDFSFGRTIALAATAFAYTVSILLSLFLKNLGLSGFSELFHDDKEPPKQPDFGSAQTPILPPEPISPPKEITPLSVVDGDKATSQIWNVPHAQNPNFTGRESLLADLRQALDSGDKAAALTQAIKGLGGIGKTQIAIEYAYRNREHYDVVWWINSEESASLAGDYARLAVELKLASADTADQNVLIDATLKWLSASSDWLLIFDNVEDRETIKPYLPPDHTGHVIITSRYSDWAGLASLVEVKKLSPDEAVAFLIKRTDKDDSAGAGKLAETLGYLPLALEQAGAYIKNRGLDYERYLELYQTRHEELLKEGEISTAYPRTVATTWSVSVESAKEKSEVAPDLLRLLAFFAPDDIPLEIIREQKDLLPEKLKNAAEDGLKLEDAVGALMTFSLIERQGNSISLHRLVQEVTRDTMSEGDAKLNAGTAVSIVNEAFPFDQDQPITWEPSGHLIIHALESAGYAEEHSVAQEETSKALNGAGSYFRTLANFSEAKECYERALKIDENIYGQDHPEVAIDLNNLANVLQIHGDLTGAREMFERALEISLKVYAKDHPIVTTIYNNLAGVLRDQGNLDGSREMYERVLEIDEKVFGQSHPTVATDLNNLAGVLHDMSELTGARDMYERALEISETAYGQNHPTVAIRLNNLAGVQKAQGELSGARKMYERALEINAKVYGKSHPAVGTTLNNLASVLQIQGELTGARQLFERVLEIDEEAYGQDHPDVATDLNNLAGVLRDQGDLIGAKELVERALEIGRKVYGEDHPKVALRLNNLALMLKDQGDLTGARKMFDRALEIDRKVYGEDHPSVAIGLSNLAGVLRDQGDLIGAKEMYERALSILTQSLGENHPSTLNAKRGLDFLNEGL